ncbi:gastrula zinc finger protein XlCGF28.1-like isoform X1 [Diorhabda sublineata]|uniref:gastrula zinc finger protein XlCGF28.1-like isoform X1 n=1 Tax=Diorhabda sublineata TaxID=1163346 RepID=UPI0024E17967|nr:gastrula zinc finger protein XlCGF28.1-like isoform X1 [Diorhabda sublineata]
MDMKQELEDAFIKEEKFYIKEHDIKQENDNYLQQTCDDVKMNEMIYDEDLECKLETDIEVDGMHFDETNSGNFNAGSSIGPVNDQARLLFKTNRTLFTEDQIDYLKEGTVSCWKHIKLGGIFICKLCGNLYVRKFYLYHHHFTQHLVKKPLRNIIKKQKFRLKQNVVNKSVQTMSILKMKHANKNEFRVDQLQDLINQIKSCATKSRSDILTKSSTSSSLDEYKTICIGRKLFECNVCLKSFSQKSYLSRHFLSHTGEKPFKCDICLKTFSQKSHLNVHLLIHTGEKRFKCDICLKTFSHKSNLNVHLLIHTGEKPFKCDICSKTFLLKSYLKIHLLTHTEEKPIKCDICLKTFSRKYDLNKHFLSHTGEKLFKCSICLKTFTRKYNLNVHLQNHKEVKPFKCNICFKSYSHKHHLKEHLLIHTGEKPFKCNICLKAFSKKYHFNRHLIIHTGEKPFKCDICSKTFTHKCNLNRHLLSHTRENATFI